MRVLVIYELVPEQTKFYLFEDPTVNVLEFLTRTHGKFINQVDWDKDLDLVRLCGLFEPESDEERAKFNSKHLIDSSKPIDCGPFDLVIHTGFLL